MAAHLEHIRTKYVFFVFPRKRKSLLLFPQVKIYLQLFFQGKENILWFSQAKENLCFCLCNISLVAWENKIYFQLQKLLFASENNTIFSFVWENKTHVSSVAETKL